jgi:hypothetical protein
MAAFKAKYDQENIKKIEKENDIMEKEWRLNCPLEAAEEDAREAAKNPQNVVGSAPVKLRKCSSTKCIIHGNKEEVKSAWHSCKKRFCTLRFCLNCEEEYGEHATVCEKPASRVTPK